MQATTHLRQRLDELEQKLSSENPVLVDVVRAFREMDATAYHMGLLDPNTSFASRISWWPLVSILGTYSAGKSSFVNHLLGRDLQRTGNQAVDDKFTVLCYSPDPEPKVLPGVALDADPRFPFYRMSQQIEAVAPGEGQRTDAYLQLKTCNADLLKGRILIDSPGFDADAQRTSVLRIVDHIMDLSDLVLVFFDARRPEPGAMRDTLTHLVGSTIKRSDSEKFVYVLNQLDMTAREDNAEEVVAAWQRGLAEHGLTAGRFYCVYNPSAAQPIENAELRKRFEAKRDRDLGEIMERIRNVEGSRAYRIVSALEKTARRISGNAVPRLEAALAAWRKRVIVLDAVLFVALALVASAVVFVGFSGEDRAGWWQTLSRESWAAATVGAAVAIVLLVLHMMVRTSATNAIARRLGAEDDTRAGDVRKAFERSTRPGRLLFSVRPSGWSKKTERRLAEIANDTTQYVRQLNDHLARAGDTQGNP